MGTYAINCSTCKKAFLWFSGNSDQRCFSCQNENKQTKEIEDLNTIIDELNQVLGGLWQHCEELEHDKNTCVEALGILRNQMNDLDFELIVTGLELEEIKRKNIDLETSISQYKELNQDLVNKLQEVTAEKDMLYNRWLREGHNQP